MNMYTGSTIFLLICFFSCYSFFILHVKTCACMSSGEISGTDPPPGECNNEDSSACCAESKFYNIYDCSPHVSNHTKANLTLESFDRGGNDSPPSECDNQYHTDYELLVALSTGWFNQGARCLWYINIHGNGKSVKAKVVDQCDSRWGCDDAHYYEPPCDNNIVSASKGIWNALGVPESRWSRMEIHWSDA